MQHIMTDNQMPAFSKSTYEVRVVALTLGPWDPGTLRPWDPGHREKWKVPFLPRGVVRPVTAACSPLSHSVSIAMVSFDCQNMALTRQCGSMSPTGQMKKLPQLVAEGQNLWRVSPSTGLWKWVMSGPWQERKYYNRCLHSTHMIES